MRSWQSERERGVGDVGWPVVNTEELGECAELVDDVAEPHEATFDYRPDTPAVV